MTVERMSPQRSYPPSLLSAIEAVYGVRVGHAGERRSAVAAIGGAMFASQWREQDPEEER